MCLGIAGPGSTNLPIGLHDATVDRVPILALSGQAPSRVLGRGAFRDLDLDGAFADVAIYSQTVHSGSDHGELVAFAVTHALGARAVARLIFSAEVQAQVVDDSRPPSMPAGRLADRASLRGETSRAVLHAGFLIAGPVTVAIMADDDRI